MNRQLTETIAGLFVLAGIIAVAYLAVSIAGQRILHDDTYELRARFNDVTGLKVGSDVRLAGVSVGNVTGIELDSDTYLAVISFNILGELSLDDDTIVAIRTNGLLGDKFLSISPGGSGFTLKPGDLIVDTESAVNLEDIIGRMAFGGVSE